MKTSGIKILFEDNKEARFNGINWFGMESNLFVPHGMWQRDCDSFLGQIKSKGYNLLRLPFSNKLLKPDSKVQVNAHENPDFENKTGLEALDLVIKKCSDRGIYVLLDRHMYEPEGANGEKWVSPEQGIGIEKWVSDWVLLANRYKDNPFVIGADVHNEPHTPEVTWEKWANWVEQCGNAILKAAPNWLIIVEGIEVFNNDWFWWGGNLQGVRNRPIKLDVANKVIYSPHEYGPSVFWQAWFNDPKFPDNMSAIWEKQWGFIITDKIAPILIGEFGGRSVDINNSDNTRKVEAIWQNRLVDYIKARDLYWTYWCLNPNSGDTGGLLLDDWLTWNEEKQRLLDRIMVTSNIPTPPTPEPIPTGDEVKVLRQVAELCWKKGMGTATQRYSKIKALVKQSYKP